ncbi:hypothetical protein Taro_001144, partial [Colocasia esculenta]|nr:hypothetical protein [Colocasia esculenta]
SRQALWSRHGHVRGARRASFVTRHTWPSRQGRDGGGRRILVVASGGVAAAFLIDVTAILSVRMVVSGGDMLVVLGARRRWPFRREGPNGSALLLKRRDLVVMAWAVVIVSRPVWASRQGRDGPMRRDYSRETEVVTVAWDPYPRAPVEGVLREAGVLESRTLERRGKRWRRQARDLIEQQDESDMPAQGQVQKEVSAEESVAQPQGAATAAAGDPEVEQPAVQQALGTGSTRAGQRRMSVTEDKTALLERFLHLRPPMFFSEYDPDKAESWTHEMEHTFETMECVEEDQVRLVVY